MGEISKQDLENQIDDDFADEIATGFSFDKLGKARNNITCCWCFGLKRTAYVSYILTIYSLFGCIATCIQIFYGKIYLKPVICKIFLMEFGISPFLEKFLTFEINCMNYAYNKDCGIDMPIHLGIIGAVCKVMIIINTLQSTLAMYAFSSVHTEKSEYPPLDLLKQAYKMQVARLVSYTVNFVIGLLGVVAFNKFEPYSHFDFVYIYCRTFIVIALVMIVNLKICKLFKDQYNFGIKHQMP